MCTGNTIIICRNSNHLTGLSLCVQGTHCADTDPVNRSRFIPVCTGNTFFLFALCHMFPVYPCVYREHKFAESGKGVFGFIPVCTGNTLIITYCLLIKIGRCKILPNFCCFFRRFSLKRFRNVIL